jgi:hypothetical protein
MTSQAIVGARAYWNRYYAASFVFGRGTEDILTALIDIPPTGTWLDLGAGSESLLWSIPLQADQLIAVDLDPQRLVLLRRYAASGQPRGAYETVLKLCRRSPADFATRCGRLTATVVADCLTGQPVPFRDGSVSMVTQFGLFGLTASHRDFLTCWNSAHQPLCSGGWCAGANWNSVTVRNRVQLSEQLYAAAFANSGLAPLLIKRVPITGDADFDSVWIYLGRKT